MAIEMHLQQRKGLTRNAFLTDHALNMGQSGERIACRAGSSLARTNSYSSALTAKRRHGLCCHPVKKCEVRELELWQQRCLCQCRAIWLAAVRTAVVAGHCLSEQGYVLGRKKRELTRGEDFAGDQGESIYLTGATAETEPAVPKAEVAFFWPLFLVPLVRLLLKSCLL